MNPVLLKPERDTHSQLVLLGQVHPQLTALPWRERSPLLWPAVRDALDALRCRNDVVVIEGAGSPAEINLQDSDIVNLRVAEHARAACLLVTDIDRGGAFAHLYGTWALLPPAQRSLLRGFVLNRFRGDPRCWPRDRRSSKRSPACPRWPRCRWCGSTACPRKTACSTTAAPPPARCACASRVVASRASATSTSSSR
jgi:hypothetical protein